MPYKDQLKKQQYHRDYNRRWYLEHKPECNHRTNSNYAKNRAARSAQAKAWEAANREKRRARKKQYYLENREAILGKCHKYIAENLEKRRASGRAWAKANRPKANAVKRRRRALEANCQGSHTAQQWTDLVLFYEHRCLKCGKREPEIKLTADHVVPIIHGGSNDISNIQPLCDSCNKSKGARAIDYRPATLLHCG